jgi:hypothetical protein
MRFPRDFKFSIGPDLRANPRLEDALEGKAVPFNQYIGLVKHCPRCGEPHKNLNYKQFKIAPASFDGTTVVASHWAMCPITEEPVLRLILGDGNHHV